ncbi:hypothetical protein GCM10028824_42030 [Hymenobacter segetis]|uniref:Uncharacterized protein n=1 Tax=Hymenobacter segetis TaxID=2025509 RepID=A0ABU9LWU1_9BACT
MSPPVGQTAVQAVRTANAARIVQILRRNTWVDAIGKSLVSTPIIGGLLHFHDPQASQFASILLALGAVLGYYYYRQFYLLRSLATAITVGGSDALRMLHRLSRLLYYFYFGHLLVASASALAIGTRVMHSRGLTPAGGVGLLGLGSLLVGSYLVAHWVVNSYFRRSFRRSVARLQTLLAE